MEFEDRSVELVECIEGCFVAEVFVGSSEAAIFTIRGALRSNV